MACNPLRAEEIRAARAASLRWTIQEVSADILLRGSSEARGTPTSVAAPPCARLRSGRVPVEYDRPRKTPSHLPGAPGAASVLLKKVEETAKPVQAPAGQRLFGDGSPCTYYPLLIEGIIRVSRFSPDGHEILLYRLNPGESCAITVVALLGETSFPAIGTAETKLSLLGVPRKRVPGDGPASPRPFEPSCSTPSPRGWRT